MIEISRFIHAMIATAYLLSIGTSLARGQENSSTTSGTSNTVATGIKWATGLSWEEVKAKAKAENKYIFIDCYATWCAPCKFMDKEVFSKDTVGKYMDGRFISIKLQLDTTKKDDQDVINAYDDAKAIRQQYSVTTLPTFLFFDPNGKLVHKETGQKWISDFMTISANAIRADKQLYTLLREYQQGMRNYDEMGYLAQTLRSIGDERLANVVADDYLNYLFKLPIEMLLTKPNIEFIGSCISNSKDRCFRFFYQHREAINMVMASDSYDRTKLDYVISREEIEPNLVEAMNSKGRTPSWKKIYSKIERKYNRELAERLVLGAKERWYEYNENWPEVHKLSVQRYYRYGTQLNSPDGVENNAAWRIFEQSNDRENIRLAIEWMGKIINEGNYDEGLLANMMDTYANLLHKGGNTNDAIIWESKAIEISKRNSWNNWVKAWTETLNKMQNGLATWPD